MHIHTFRIPDYHRLWLVFPDYSTIYVYNTLIARAHNATTLQHHDIYKASRPPQRSGQNINALTFPAVDIVVV